MFSKTQSLLKPITIMSVKPNTLDKLRFDNTYSNLPSKFFSKLPPTPVNAPYLISYNPKVGELLDIDSSTVNTKEAAEYFSGNKLLPGSNPLAMLYSGHQFGYYVQQLGDGRAILLGQVRNHQDQLWDLHIKGGGPTPYSRGGDGRAVLRSTIREYLGSEAVHYLGIPTTRGLCITGTKDEVYRESIETGAMLIRVAQSHVRFGSFEVFFYRKQHENLKILADYVMNEHFKEIPKGNYAAFYSEVVKRTATMIAKWMSVGYENGVMNTDNMSILGLTIDYGPFGFVERYDPDWVVNHSDDMGRYALSNQPAIGEWNLKRLAIALSGIDQFNSTYTEELQDALLHYQPTYEEHYDMLMNKKLGLQEVKEGDQTLTKDLLKILSLNGGIDFTNFYRGLSNIDHSQPVNAENYIKTLTQDESHLQKLQEWMGKYTSRLSQQLSLTDENQTKELKERMLKVNPKFIPRAHVMQTAIVAAQQDDFSIVNTLLNLYQNPFDEHPGNEKYTKEAPRGFSNCLTCSS
ncbi:UPF0061 [Acrasis kona]|uniref:Selenoprotein O n=1 Tax=Acrasis kona TaxID=1008807 RepID=A0AAW2ZPT5_9EUKA